MIDSKDISEDYKNPTWLISPEGHKYKAFWYNGMLCKQESKQKRRYSPLYPYELQNFKIIDKPVHIEKTFEKKKKDFETKRHFNAWVNLSKEIKQLEENSSGSEREMIHLSKYYNITKIFTEAEIELVKRAFKGEKELFKLGEFNKENYYFSLRHNAAYNSSPNARDYSLSVKLENDGSVMAWFSSEYKGCGNGDYYLLINPTTAIFYEKD